MKNTRSTCLAWLLAFLACTTIILVCFGRKLLQFGELQYYNAGTAVYDTDVRFWGKVVDQEGQPVPGVTIKAMVVTLRMIKVGNGLQEYVILSTQSANDGSFMFDGAQGFSLSIVYFSKEGYVLPSAYQAGIRFKEAMYSYLYKSMGNMEKVFRPDRSRPVVFHLWKLNQPEPLVIDGRWDCIDGPEFQIGADAKPLTLSGKYGDYCVTHGLARDFTVTVRAVGSAEAPEWEVTVAAVEPDGGVIKADPADVFLFRAPESGYEHSIKFRYGPEGTEEMNADPGSPVRFYVRSKGGRWHAAVEYGFFAPRPDGKLATRRRFWMNPGGSCNLEHDAAHPLPRPNFLKD